MNGAWIRLDDGSGDESRASSPLYFSYTSSHGFLQNSSPESNGSRSDMESDHDMENTVLSHTSEYLIGDQHNGRAIPIAVQ